MKTKTDEIIEELKESIDYIRDKCKWIDFGELKALEKKLTRCYEKALKKLEQEKDKEISKYVKIANFANEKVYELKTKLKEKETELKNEIHKSSTYFKEKLECMKKLKEKDEIIRAMNR